MNKLTQLSFSILSLFGCTPSKAVDTKPIAPFELDRYLGRWYEIARFNHSFERGLTRVTATYSMNEDGSVRVENSGIKNGRPTTAIGKAKITDGGQIPLSGSLEVSFFWIFYAPYRIIMLSEDYSYALVTSGKNYLWILSRTAVLPRETLDKILAEATRRGFDTSKLIIHNA